MRVGSTFVGIVEQRAGGTDRKRRYDGAVLPCPRVGATNGSGEVPADVGTVKSLAEFAQRCVSAWGQCSGAE